MKLSAKSKFTAVAIFFSIIIFDQVTKWLVVRNSINYFCNSNGPFGINGRFFLISTAALIVISILYKREKNEQTKGAFLIILAAGSSNIFDRLIYGCVRDFINLGFWPAFNFADSLVTVGAVVIIYNLGKEYLK